ncbi:hypothetical protein [Natrinema sp. HArc-T2]
MEQAREAINEFRARGTLPDELEAEIEEQLNANPLTALEKVLESQKN